MKGGWWRALRTRMAPLKALQSRFTQALGASSTVTHRKHPPGFRARTMRETRRGLVVGQEVSERAKGDGDVELRLEGHLERVPAGELERRGTRGVRSAPSGHVKHALAEVDAHHPLRASGAEDAHGGARPAAHVECGSDMSDPGQRREQDLVGGTERGVIELGRNQVIAPLGRGEGLDGQFEERGTMGMKHARAASRGGLEGPARREGGCRDARVPSAR